MNPSEKIEYDLDVAYGKYFQDVTMILNNYSKQIIKPYLLKNNLRLVSGMGAWNIRNNSWLLIDESGWFRAHYDPLLARDEKPEMTRKLHQIVKILSTKIPGMGSNNVGSMMEDI